MGRLATGTSNNSVSEYETYQIPIYLVRGDTLPAIELTLRDKNTAAEGVTLDENDSDTWAPYDLTGATVSFKFRAEGSSEVKDVLPMMITGNPSDGKVTIIWGPTTLDTAGVFTGEIEITSAESKVATVFEQLRFVVREDY